MGKDYESGAMDEYEQKERELLRYLEYWDMTWYFRWSHHRED